MGDAFNESAERFRSAAAQVNFDDYDKKKKKEKLMNTASLEASEPTILHSERIRGITWLIRRLCASFVTS